jgi:branched-chain amino acid transport system permease protein
MLTRSQQVLLVSLLVSAGLSAVAHRINPYFLDIIIGIGINVILAVSLNLINGYTGQFSLGHAGFMAVGAYASAAITMFAGPKVLGALGGPSLPATSALYLAALLAGGAVAAAAGVVVGAPSLRLKGDYLAIVTLGFGEIIRVLFRNVEVLGGALGLNGIPAYTNLFWTFAFAALTIYVVTSLVHSTYGRGFLATHDDELAAEAMGVATTRYKIAAFVTGAFFAGIAGGLYGHFKLSIDPAGFNFMRSIEIVVMVILGGMGNTTGVIIAAVLLSLMPEVFRKFGDFRMILYSALLIVLMILRPQGLFSFRRRRGAVPGTKAPRPTTA